MVYPDRISTFKLPTLFTVFSNELTAIKEAMTYILQANGSQLLIFTDSKSAVVEIQDPFTTNKIVQEVQILSTELHSNQTDVSTVRILSHRGTPGNEQADKMATVAAALPTYDADILTPHWTQGHT
jgi:ribonuclease HI